MAYSKIILNGETLMDVTSDTVAAGSLLSGKTATKNDGTKVTGNIASKTASDLTASGATVTAAAGYYPSAVSKAVIITNHPNPTAAITSSTGVITATHTQGTGYVTGGTTTGTLNLTTKAAATINTSTADQTVASYRWLTGTQTIKSVTTTNLTAANIANGVVVKVGDANNASRIAQVTGTYAPAVSSVTVTPTETTQTFNATGVYGYKPVTVNGISSTYVGTGIARKSSADVAFASATATFTAPIGYYSAAATKTLTTQAAQTIYPSTADQTVASYRWLTGNQTIKSVVTSNLTAENIAEGVVIKIGDANNASRITQVTGTYSANAPYYGIYQAYAKGETIRSQGSTLYNYTSDEVVSFCNSFSGQIEGNFFAGLPLSGQFTFNNISALGMDTFAYTDYPSGGATLIFPNLSFINNRCFSSNTNIKEIQIPKCSRINAYDFYYCHRLTDVYAPSCTSIGLRAFYSCSSLSTVSFPACTFIGSYAFVSCITLTTVSFPVCTSIGTYAFYNCSSLITINFPNCITVGDNTFNGCGSLTTVSFPSCTSIEYYTFYNCYSLTTVSFPVCTSIGYNAFYNCSSLSTVSFPVCTSIGTYAFNSCSFLTTVSFPSCTFIGSSAFYNCSSLSIVSFPVCTSIGSYAFQGCRSLTTVNLPICTSFGYFVFSGCFNLISLYLNSVSSVPIFGTDMFSSTPISNYSTSAGRYGSIFVPSSLYTAFTTATGWTKYSARMVSV